MDQFYATSIVIGVMVLLVLAYLTPTIIAFCLHKRNAGAIMVLNLLLGWTVLGWIVAAVWCCVHEDSGA